MVFRLPASKLSIDQNRFEVESPDGKQHWSLPSLKYMKPSLMAEVESRPGLSGSKYLFDTIAPGMFDVFDSGEQVEALMDAWQEFSGVSTGESSASAGS